MRDFEEESSPTESTEATEREKGASTFLRVLRPFAVVFSFEGRFNREDAKAAK